MASYFRWIKGSKKEESLYQKPRSRSLDGKSLELSGIKLLLHHVGTNSDFLMLLWLQFKPLDSGYYTNACVSCSFNSD
jgi:hypothetical protein